MKVLAIVTYEGGSSSYYIHESHMERALKLAYVTPNKINVFETIAIVLEHKIIVSIFYNPGLDDD